MKINTIQLVADLCAIIDQQNVIIQAQALALAEHEAVVMAEEITASRQAYMNAVGTAPAITGEVKTDG